MPVLPASDTKLAHAAETQARAPGSLISPRGMWTFAKLPRTTYCVHAARVVVIVAPLIRTPDWVGFLVNGPSIDLLAFVGTPGAAGLSRLFDGTASCEDFKDTHGDQVAAARMRMIECVWDAG